MESSVSHSRKGIEGAGKPGGCSSPGKGASSPPEKEARERGGGGEQEREIDDESVHPPAMRSAALEDRKRERAEGTIER